MLFYAGIIPAFVLFTVTLSQNVPLRGPPQFESNPQYLDSYIPASMQVIAYLTEMMKYDIKPTVTTTTARVPPISTTTKRPVINTTRRPVTVTTKRPSYNAAPTPYHKPALYAPYIPPSFIISRTPTEDSNVDSYEAYVNRLSNPLGHYFDRYMQIIDQLSRQRRATPFDYSPMTTGPREKDVSSAMSDSSRRSKRSRRFETAQNGNQTRNNLQVGQNFVSLKGSRAQPAVAPRVQPRTQLQRSRSARSLSKDKIHTESVEDDATMFFETSKAKARALTIKDDSFNAHSVDYLGFGLNELIKEIQSEGEGLENQLTDEDRVKMFSTKYDDVNFGSYLLREKKIPPTKAYVTLLSLYDLLNKESKKLMLNKYNGYSTAIIEELIETSTGTSSEQLRIILHRIIDRPDTHDSPIRTKITALLADLATSNSYINDALRYIPPLSFSK